MLPMTEIHTPGSQSLEDFISIASAVRTTGYSEQYLRRLVRRQVIRAVKFGHFWLVDQRSLQDYIERAARKYEQDRRFGPRESED